MKLVSKLLGSFTILLGGWLVSPQPLMALDLKPDEIRGEKVTNPVSILQNRYFLKSFRPEVGFSAGSFVNEAYTDTILWGYRTSMFINEWLGFELQAIQTSVSDSDDRKALNQLKYQKIGTTDVVSPDPEINRIHGSQDVNVIVAPFYGKLNLIDSVIIYSDLYMAAGVSKVDTDQGELNSFSWAAGQRFYWKKSISFRFEVRDRIYQETRSDEDYTRHAYSIDLGMSYFLF
ncbi:outer membrane beta-barrel domain-containing protein [Pseudobacteriovorax antillogorgiicola]|uniref:Outer membrane beta-barrel protein n=1 Tax=Pseudobacteriovorax antillogorgiicola TaxID=1513793 RepID=A0A1Y6C5P1_9BACT|nr:outer membrane beta-barrel domain-containing protein [Pseudobacteriovorax antillogorgiicola]TCS49413.1 outer membrane beta-barrel protein [Pseudobacteriovorax antillogorgiicola]SMF46936.1 outer membrane beta-barrel protein [Pseudobacteriovorax antillogorgiicola]